MQKKNNGFTLVELAIVMMIIGLLIGGILKGQKMMENARITATISQVHSYTAALAAFMDKYSAIPGDMINASTRIPNCTSTTLCGDGDGTSIVGAPGDARTDRTGAAAPNVETTYFWKHLVLSDLISGVNPSANPAYPAWGETHPASRINGGFHVFYETVSSRSGLHVVLRNRITGDVPSAANDGSLALSPQETALIDRKMDDGQAGSGSVRAGGVGCWNGYVEDNTQKNCYAIFRLMQ